jgi:dephospho-CoA kinase
MDVRGVIGLTGGIACGKSEAAAVLRAEGVPVLDTDAVAHALLQPGHAVFESVVAAFGRGYLTDAGDIDRRKLGGFVFADDEARAKLNGIMHPEIYRVSAVWVSEQKARHAWVVVMVPLLYETGAEKRFERVIVVAADEEIMMRRMSARGWSHDEATARLRAQLPVAEKVCRADAVIWNNGDLAALKDEVLRIWRQLVLQAGKEK